MVFFSKKINPQGQFIIVIKITKPFSQNAYRDGTAQKHIARTKGVRALIDTGANRTSIVEEYANKLGLRPFSKTKITGVGSTHDVDEYRVDLVIPVAKTGKVPFTDKDGKTHLKEVVREDNWIHLQHKICAIPDIGVKRSFDAILGMDILTQMHISMVGGTITMSF